MSSPESQNYAWLVICPYCFGSYIAEPTDYSEEEREETCDTCDKTYLVRQSFTVTNHTRPKREDARVKKHKRQKNS